MVPDNSGPDPANANMAPVANNQPQPAAAPVPRRAVLGVRYQAQPQQSYEQYPQQQYPSQQYPPQQYPQQQYPPQETAPPPPDQDQAYQDAQTAEQLDEEGETPPVEYADEPPPPLPVYEQPEAPAPNDILTPGYWGWAPAGYYDPGAWCAPPYYGALWTPAYWGWYHNRWGFHHGYWGPHIGFYGGINYGFGYTGVGYYGGYWHGNDFYYNRAANRISPRITNVYNRTIIINNNTRIAYNGGRGGVADRPRPAEIEAMRGPRVPPMSTQIQHQREAQQDRQQFYNVNRGRPAMVAAPRPIAAQPGFTQGSRPGQPETRQVQSGFRPGEPNNRPQIQPNRPGQPEVRQGQPELRPGEPQTRPMQPDNRPSQPQFHPDNRPAQPRVAPSNHNSRRADRGSPRHVPNRSRSQGRTSAPTSSRTVRLSLNIAPHPNPNLNHSPRLSPITVPHPNPSRCLNPVLSLWSGRPLSPSSAQLPNPSSGRLPNPSQGRLPSRRSSRDLPLNRNPDPKAVRSLTKTAVRRGKALQTQPPPGNERTRLTRVLLHQLHPSNPAQSTEDTLSSSQVLPQ
jgi:hypothetical protein